MEPTSLICLATSLSASAVGLTSWNLRTLTVRSAWRGAAEEQVGADRRARRGDAHAGGLIECLELQRCR